MSWNPNERLIARAGSRKGHPFDLGDWKPPDQIRRTSGGPGTGLRGQESRWAPGVNREPGVGLRGDVGWTRSSAPTGEMKTGVASSCALPGKGKGTFLYSFVKIFLKTTRTYL